MDEQENIQQAQQPIEQPKHDKAAPTQGQDKAQLGGADFWWRCAAKRVCASSEMADTADLCLCVDVGL